MLKELRLVSELTSQGQHWKRIPLSAFLPFSHHMLFRLTWSDSIARSALFYVTIWFLMGDGCLYYIRAPVGWKSSKPYTGAQVCHPTRRGEGNNMGKLWEWRRHPPPVTLTSDDTPEKWVLLTIFFCLFSLLHLYAFLSFIKMCLNMIAGHGLLSKLFIRCHQYLTLAKLEGEKHPKQHYCFKIISN